MFYSSSLATTFISNLTRHTSKSYKGVMDLYEQGLSIFAWQMTGEKRTFQRGASIVVDLTLMYDRDGGGKEGVACPFFQCGPIRIFEVGSHEKTPPDMDFGDRLNRKSQVGHGLETLRKVLSNLAESTQAAVSGSGTISRPKYKKSVLTYLLRSELAGEPVQEEKDPEEERKRLKEVRGRDDERRTIKAVGANGADKRANERTNDRRNERTNERAKRKVRDSSLSGPANEQSGDDRDSSLRSSWRARKIVT